MREEVKVLIQLLVLLCVLPPVVAAGGPLHDAARDGDLDKINEQIAEGADVNEKDSAGNTPLALATYYGHTEVVKTLCENGANLTVELMLMAARDGRISIAEFFISKGVDVNWANQGKFTPLYMATLNGHKEIVELLIDKGADVNVKTNKGKAPLFVAVEWKYSAIAEMLVDHGADLKIRNNKGSTLLQMAIFNNDKDMVEMLLSKGANVNDENKNRKTPLNTAVEFGQREVAESLRQHGARLNHLEEMKTEELPFTGASDSWLLKVTGLRAITKRKFDFYSLGGMNGSIYQISSIPDYSTGFISSIGLQQTDDGPTISWSRRELTLHEDFVLTSMDVIIRNNTNQELSLKLPDIRLENQDGFFNETPRAFKIKDQPIYKMVDCPIKFPPSEDFAFELLFIIPKRAYRVIVIFPTLEGHYVDISKSLG
jgi:ankyrin repeat protein